MGRVLTTSMCVSCYRLDKHFDDGLSHRTIKEHMLIKPIHNLV